MRLACNISLIFTEVPTKTVFAAHLAGFKTVEIQFPTVELAVLQSRGKSPMSMLR